MPEGREDVVLILTTPRFSTSDFKNVYYLYIIFILAHKSLIESLYLAP
jgi:hypothetical protein